jgi:hypothetical protein
MAQNISHLLSMLICSHHKKNTKESSWEGTWTIGRDLKCITIPFMLPRSYMKGDSGIYEEGLY